MQVGGTSTTWTVPRRRDPGLGDRVLDERAHVDGRERERGAATVDAAEVEQVADEGAEAFGLGEGGAQDGVVGAHDAVDEVLEQGLLGGERRAQLVRHRGDELAPLLVRVGEVGGHGVEGGGEHAHLVGEVAVTRGSSRRSPSASGVGHLAQRRGHAARQPLGHSERRDDGHRHGEPDGTPARSPISATSAAATMLAADEQAELGLDRADAVERARSESVGARAEASRA